MISVAVAGVVLLFVGLVRKIKFLVKLALIAAVAAFLVSVGKTLL